MTKITQLFIAVLLTGLGLTWWSQPIKAAVLQLTSIGNSLTPTTAFTTFTYEGENPVLVGKAAAAAQVTILLNSASNQVTADNLGAWVFTPTTLLVGTHAVEISSGSEALNFNLIVASASASTSGTTSATPTPTGSASAGVGGVETLPQSGGFGLTLMIAVAGFGVVGLGLMGWSSVQAARLMRQNEVDQA